MRILKNERTDPESVVFAGTEFQSNTAEPSSGKPSAAANAPAVQTEAIKAMISSLRESIFGPLRRNLMIFRFREPFYYKRWQLARNFDWNKAVQKVIVTDRWTSPNSTSERLQLRLHTSVKNEFGNLGFEKRQER